MTHDITPLLAWFKSQSRDLPWRDNPTPYSVWISEIMLQQTQVKTVIPYFERWMAKYPTLKSLAEAKLEEVIKVWEGLGYYSRARNIHFSAQNLIKHGFKEISEENFHLMKGLGPYTKGAIRSFAFRKKAPAVDGNVLRVISRLTLYEEDITKTSTKKEVESIVLKLLPDEKPWIAMEALIELGALICQKKAKCTQCPLQKECLGFKENKVHLLPKKKEGPKVTRLERSVLIIKTQTHVLLKKGEKGKIMQDLYEFPWVEGLPPKLHFCDQLILNLKKETQFPPVEHSFTKYRATLYPFLIELKECCNFAGYEWVLKESLKELPFSSGHRQLLLHLA